MYRFINQIINLKHLKRRMRVNSWDRVSLKGFWLSIEVCRAFSSWSRRKLAESELSVFSGKQVFLQVIASIGITFSNEACWNIESDWSDIWAMACYYIWMKRNIGLHGQSEEVYYV
ncbi:hypothetical protein P8452_56746 [Trifolium repens]|nr:hypothetical protein P8452_56746 [Trifolium repens]